MTEGRARDAAEGLWMLKVAIIAATSGLIATTVADRLAAGIVLYVAAIIAFTGFWWKYGVPFAQWTLGAKKLLEFMEQTKKDRAEDRKTLVEIAEKQDEIAEKVVAVAAQVAEVEKVNARIERGAELAAERADAAINVAEAVRRQLGAVARKEDP